MPKKNYNDRNRTEDRSRPIWKDRKLTEHKNFRTGPALESLDDNLIFLALTEERNGHTSAIAANPI